MIYLCTDYETYYSKEYSLSKISTQHYILDPRFEVIMMAARVFRSDNKMFPATPEPVVYYQHQIQGFFDSLKPYADEVILVGHNSGQFDNSITRWKYGFAPGFSADTMVMARSVGLSAPVGLSLKALTETLSTHKGTYLRKGTYVADALGKRLADFSPAELRYYSEYCATDVNATVELFLELATHLSPDEMGWQSLIADCYTARPLRIDSAVVEQELARVQAARAAMMNDLMSALNVEDNNGLMEIIGSNPKFAATLTLFGVTPPTKRSKTNPDIRTFAFAKTDPAMIELTHHADPMVAALATARLGLKSSIDETRCTALIDRAVLGPMPAPYAASGAHTHRLSGCLVGDTKIVCYDKVYGCVEKNITDVQLSDLVWDGEEFVTHEGVQFRGVRPVESWEGVTGTHCHPVFTRENEGTTTPLAEAKRQGARPVDCKAPAGWRFDAGRLVKETRIDV